MPPTEASGSHSAGSRRNKRVPTQVAAHLAEHLSDEPLTEREIQVLGQIAGGNRNKDIAEKTGLSLKKQLRFTSSTSWKSSAQNESYPGRAIGLRRGIIHLE